ncbi:hypothetical protein AAG906_029548 [Vitis piasezkii]
MSADLRANFKERHRKRLHEAIDMVLPPAKKACPKGLERVGPTLGGASGGAAPVEEVLDQKDTHASVFPPSWDEMMDILKHVPCFTDAKPPSTKMSDFFPLTKQISVNLGGNLPVFTVEVVTSSILLLFRIMHTSLAGTNPISIISSSWWGVEALKLAKGEREAIHIEADKLKKKSGVVEAKLKGIEQEISQLKKEIEELRARFTTQKKEMEELQTRFAVQKNELEARFAA